MILTLNFAITPLSIAALTGFVGFVFALFWLWRHGTLLTKRLIMWSLILGGLPFAAYANTLFAVDFSDYHMAQAMCVKETTMTSNQKCIDAKIKEINMKGKPYQVIYGK